MAKYLTSSTARTVPDRGAGRTPSGSHPRMKNGGATSRSCSAVTRSVMRLGQEQKDSASGPDGEGSGYVVRDIQRSLPRKIPLYAVPTIWPSEAFPLAGWIRELTVSAARSPLTELSCGAT